MYRAGTINAKTFVCLEGSSAWQELSAVEHRFLAPVTGQPQLPTGDHSALAIARPVKGDGRGNPAKKASSSCLFQFLFLLLFLPIGFAVWESLRDTPNETPSSSVSAPTPPSPQTATSPIQVVPSNDDQAAAKAEQQEDDERTIRQSKEQANSQKDAAIFRQMMTSIDADSNIVTSVSVGSGPIDSGELTIAVVDKWHSQPYQDRLQLAQAFWRLWITIHSPGFPNESQISITDQMGNEVGGWSLFSGVWVQKD